MAEYRAVTTYGDFGPWISKLVLTLPAGVSGGEVPSGAFSVYCARMTAAGEVATVVERPSLETHPSRGYVPVLAAYACDERGTRCPGGDHVALELPEVELTSRINVASVTAAEYVENRFIVTQTAKIPSSEGPLEGLAFDECAGVDELALAGWSHGRGGSGEYELGYACFDPRHDAEGERAPRSSALVVWLHGASDGGSDVRLPYTASHVTLLAGTGIQGHFAGGAWLLVPQCPTFWMDDGVEQMGRSGRSVYAASLKSLIDEFVAAHDDIDPDRVVIGGLSNGGFMTLRMLIDYPGFFSAGVGCCAPLYEEAQTPEVVAAIARTPLWLVQSKDDFIVDARQTVFPLYRKLVDAGAEVHLTCYDHVEDLTGRYKDELGNPRRSFGHGVWIHVFNDFCHTELDGRNVLLDGEPVTVWEWAARHVRRQ